MNAKHFVLAMVILICTCLVSPLLAIGGNGKGGGASPILTEKQATDLIFLREEEKLARDVYLELYDVWGTQIFLNISGSEQRHMDSVASLLDKYGLEDPVGEIDQEGEFTNDMIAGLYETLVIKGSSSLRDAMEVGVIIEEMDIHDIEVEMLPDATQRDVERVLTNLLAGSYNHLEAFEKSIAALP